MPYKLTYFNIRGLGEPVRYLLAYMGEEYEDNRIEFSRQGWTPELKKSTKWGRIPTLEFDGETYSDSAAICRYLGHKAGLVGATPLENLKIDELAGVIQDLAREVREMNLKQYKAEKEKVLKHLQDEIFPFYVERFEKTIKENGGYVANGKLSWMDLFFVAFSEVVADLSTTGFMEKFPHVQALKDKVWSNPGIKAWIAKRPQTPM